MHHFTYGTLLSLLSATTFAAPLVKRDLIYVTDWDIVTQTQVVVNTIWVTAGAAPVAPTMSAIEVSAPSTSTESPAIATSSPVAIASSTSAILTSTPPILSTSTASSSSVLTTSSLPSTTIAIVSSAPPPAPTSSVASPPATSSAAAPATQPIAKSTPPIAGLATSGTSYTGDLTYYATGLGSCGWNSGYNDAIVAVSHDIMDVYNPGNPNNNPLCGRDVTITYAGQQYQAKVVDTCEGCAQGDLDLSEGFFSLVTGGDTAAGRIGGVEWKWT